MRPIRPRKHIIRSGETRYGRWYLSIEFILQDMWVGAFWKSAGSIGQEIRPGAPVKAWQEDDHTYYWQRTNWDLYICLIPTIVFHYKWHLNLRKYR